MCRSLFYLVILLTVCSTGELRAAELSENIQEYLKWALIPILFVGIMVTFGLFYLKRQISLQTRELQLEINGRTWAEEKLAERNRFIESLMDLSPDILYIYDIVERKNIYSNDGIQKVLGYSVKEIQDMGEQLISTLMYPEDMKIYLEETLPRYAHAKDNEQIYHQYRMQHRNGDWHWLECKEIIYKRLADGSPRQIFGVIHDITEIKQTEIALIESKERYRQLFNTMMNGFALHEIICDSAGKPIDYRFIKVNASFERLTGLAACNLIGRTVSEVLPGTEPYWIETYGQVALTGKPIQFENYSGALDKYYSVTAYSPKHKQFAVIFEDITVRRQAENALKETERAKSELLEKLNEAQHIAMIGSWEWNLKNNHVWWSDETYRIFGVTPQEFVPSFEENGRFIHPDDLARYRKSFEYSLQTGESLDVDLRLVVNNGLLKHCQAKGKVVYDDSGQPIRFVGTVMDITERKQSEDALLKSERQLKLITDNLPAYIAYVGLNDLRYRFVNLKFEESFKIPRNRIIGSHIKDVVGQSNYEVALKYLDIVRQGQAASYENRFVTAGTERWIEVNYVPDINEHGCVEAVVVLSFDITERKKLEDQLRQAQKMEAVGQLAGGVAHDFNNLLYVITGYSEMMMAELPPDGFLHTGMKEIMNATERAATLVRQLLLFSRREAMQLKYLDLNEVVSDLMKMIRRMIGEHIALEIQPGFALKTVYADPGQIEQVLMNLCINARDAMPDGGKIIIETANISIDAEYCQCHIWATEGNYVLLTVSDTGCGIPYEVRDRIFEPFFTTKEVGKGTGLGLAAVYGIVSSHGGMIKLCSEPGQGTTFRIYLPSSESAPSSDNDKKDSEKPLVIGKETILVAEDEESVRNMMVHVLKKNGYRVLSATDGEEAVSLFEKHFSEINLALLDVMMPKAGGQKVYGHIRKIRPDMGHLHHRIQQGYSGFAHIPEWRIYDYSETLQSFRFAV